MAQKLKIPEFNLPLVEQPPSYESTLPQKTSSEPSGFVPSTEIYVGQHQRHRSRGRVGKTMQVGNATYTDLRHDCIEAFCEDCQKRVSRGLFKRFKNCKKNSDSHTNGLYQ